MKNKDCSICVYEGPCRDRKSDNSIKDCCIPEAPLREAQSMAKNTIQFIAATKSYILNVKKKSLYWRMQLKKME